MRNGDKDTDIFLVPPVEGRNKKLKVLLLDKQKMGRMAECLSHECFSRTAHFLSHVERKDTMWSILLKCRDEYRKRQNCDVSLSVCSGPSEKAERCSSPPCAEKTRQMNFWWITQMHLNNLDSPGWIQSHS